MLRPILALAALGFVGVLAWKVIFFPMLAGMFGFLLKVAFLAAVVFFLLWFFRKRGEDTTPDQS
jgi:uncharacterized membrane protein